MDKKVKVALSACILLAGAGGAGMASAYTTVPTLWEPSSQVTDTVTQNGSKWEYSFTVKNTSALSLNGNLETEPVIVDWEIPYFDDAGITNILAPGGWGYTIETIGTSNPSTGWGGTAAWQDPNDPMYWGADSPYTTATQVLHWFSLCWVTDGEIGDCGSDNESSASNLSALTGAIRAGEELSGFGFTANYGPQNGPYQASWADLPVLSGDPQLPFRGIPASPKAKAPQAVPEPAGILLIGLGVAALGFRRRV